MDGIDAGVYKIGPKTSPDSALQQETDGTQESSSPSPRLQIETIHQALYPFDSQFQSKLKDLVNNPEPEGTSGSTAFSLDQLCRLDAALGEEFARAANLLMQEAGTKADLIGSHGQTIWHAPAEKLFAGIPCRNTWQLGEAAVIAERTQIPVVSDFRVQDMAAGGQGAPLVAFADELIFGQEKEAVGILNLGGIANITVLSREGRAVMAFDSGPGNMIADRCAERLFKQPFDQGGKIAYSGSVDENWLAELMNHPYFRMPPPKTTGREDFGISFADNLIHEAEKRGLSSESTMATLSALTGEALSFQYRSFILPEHEIRKLVLGGGGAENEFIKSQIRRRWPNELQILKHEDYGISTKFKEALLFALLAYTSHFRIPNNVPVCTGARRRLCLGKLCLP